jgi:anaerobic ribonucleoside-triphosphate reductase activating protein
MTGSLRLHRTLFPVTVLGPGIRAGIWVQGCGIGCVGCMSRDTWDPAGGRTVPVAELLGWLGGLPPVVTGVTVSGGEPFEQAEALTQLLDGIAALSVQRETPLDVMAYSGFTLAALRRSPARWALLERCDVVITGPFVPGRAPGGSWRGSANQRLVVRTDLGRRRFGADADTDGFRPGLQAVVEPQPSAALQLRVIGVPAPGELERLERGLARRGLSLAGTSWRAPGPDGIERVAEETG